MLSVIIAAAAAVSGLADRPAGLIGDRTQADYSQWLAAEALRVDERYAGQACPDAEVSSTWPVVPAPPSFAAARGFSDVGEEPIVHERLRVTGCGSERVVNLLAFRLKAGGWRSVGLPPGQTRADARLQTDAIGLALLTARSGAPALSCTAQEQAQSLRYAPIRVSERPNEAGVWKELWPISLCGQDRPVELTFTPGESGTTFTARPAW